MELVVGTAGHIDHGKTALVKALTGTDTDRLPEEKKRGITIDLGFAELETGGVHFGFVDVPGHERFVKNMLAGASGIDVVMLVIAADEGVMPQTREHFDICRLLDTRDGIVVLTKHDLVDEEMLDLVRLEAAELVEGSFLENAPVVAVSSKTGEGIEELKSELISVAKANRAIRGASEVRVPILPIDRVFTMKGFGTVVTGTLASGRISEGDELDLLPIGKTVRVRGIQTHGTTVKEAHAGQRTAINIAGIDHYEIERGMLLAEKGALRPTQAFDTRITVLSDAKRSVRNRQRVRVHIGSAEAMARVTVLNDAGEIVQGDNDFAQLRFETSVVAIYGERSVIRSYSPQMTVAGGRVLDAFAPRHRRKEFDAVRSFLQELDAPADDQVAVTKLFVEQAGEHCMDRDDLQARTGWANSVLVAATESGIKDGSLVSAENIFVTHERFDSLKAKSLDEIERFHKCEPLSNGIGRETLREKMFAGIPDAVFKAVLSVLERERKIVTDKDVLRSAKHTSELSEEEEIVRARLEKIYRHAKLEVPKLDEAFTDAAKGTNLKPDRVRRIFQLLLTSGEIMKVSEDFYFASKSIDDLIAKLKAFADASADRLIDVPKFKEIAGVSRKYAIPLLEYFDREKVTVRSGDKRLIIK